MLIRSSICLAARNYIFGVDPQYGSFQHGQLLRLARIFEFLYVAHLAIVLPGEKIVKALISLCVCPDWSAALLQQNQVLFL